MYSRSFFILPCFLFTVCFLLRSIKHGQDFIPELVCQVYVRARAGKLYEGELGSKKTTTNCGMNVNVLVCQVYTHVQVNSMKVNLVVVL